MGDLLFTIDTRPFEAALRQAEAALAKDLAQAKYAHEQVRRYGGLLKDGIVTQDQFDQVRANADTFDANIAADRAAIDNAKVQLGYCRIRSPIDGRTGNLMVQAIADGDIGSIAEARDVVRRSFEVDEYEPKNTAAWDEAYGRFLKVIA